MGAVGRYVTTDKKAKHKDPRDETGRKLSQVARLRRLEAQNRDLEATNAELVQEVHVLSERLGELQDILVDFCSAMADKRRSGSTGRAETTRMIRRVSALTDEHRRRDTRSFEPDDLPGTEPA